MSAYLFDLSDSNLGDALTKSGSAFFSGNEEMRKTRKVRIMGILRILRISQGEEWAKSVLTKRGHWLS